MKCHRSLLLSLLSLSLLLLVLLPEVGSAQKLTNPTKLYKGSVLKAETTTPAGEGMVYVYEDPYPNPVTSSRVNPTSGEYSVILDPSHVYRFRLEILGCYTNEVVMSTPAGTNYEELIENFDVTPIPVDSLLYEGTPFTEGSESLSDDGDGALQEILSFLAENRTVIVSIGVGLVKDEVDPVTKKRVEAIKQLFTDKKISTTRIHWQRLVGTPLGRYKIKVDAFGFEEKNNH